MCAVNAAAATVAMVKPPNRLDLGTARWVPQREVLMIYFEALVACMASLQWPELPIREIGQSSHCKRQSTQIYPDASS